MNQYIACVFVDGSLFRDKLTAGPVILHSKNL